jgi:hypothetical protein
MTDSYLLTDDVEFGTTNGVSLSTEATEMAMNAFNERLERNINGASRAGYDWVVVVHVRNGFSFDLHIHLLNDDPSGIDYQQLFDGEVAYIDQYDCAEVRKQLEQGHSTKNPTTQF